MSKIHLPHGAIKWIAEHSGYGREYVAELVNDPANFKGSPTARLEILKSIEAFKSMENKTKAEADRKLNALLSTSKYD